MLRQICALLFLIFSFHMLWSQRKPPIKWGKIDASQLQMSKYEPDTSAAAVVLCNFGKIEVEFFGGEFNYRFTQHKRIKILKDAGLDYGNLTVPYYHHEGFERMAYFKGQVLSPTGEVRVLKKKAEIFYEKINERWSAVKAAFPVEVGSVIEYKFEIVSEGLVKLREWQFQEEIPTIYNELQVSYPDFYAYNYLFQGGEYMEKEEDGDVTILRGDNGTIKLGDGWFIMENAVALKEPERYFTTMDDYVAKIRFQLNKIFYNDGRESSFLSTWEKLADDLEHRDFLGQQFLRKRNHKNILEAVMPAVEGMISDTEKAKYLYRYFSKNMTWNGVHGGIWVKSTLDDAFEKKQGYYSEINYMLLACLLALEIEAYPVLTSTREHGKMYENYPLVDQFDHVMVYAVLNGKPTILDAGDELRPFGFPRDEALNGRGWLMKKEPEWIHIPAPRSGEAFSLELTLDGEGTALGTMKGAYRGYNAIPERRHFKANSEGGHWIGRLSEKYPEVKIAEVKCENLDDTEQTFKDEFEILIPEAGQAIGDFIYFTPVIYSNFDENIFKLEKRHYPVDIPYPINEQYLLKLTIPEGYEIEDLPESAKITLEGKSGFFSFLVEQKDEKTIQLVSRIQIRKLRFSPFEYPALKEMFDLAAEKCGEQIVLKKRGS